MQGLDTAAAAVVDYTHDDYSLHSFVGYIVVAVAAVVVAVVAVVVVVDALVDALVDAIVVAMLVLLVVVVVVIGGALVVHKSKNSGAPWRAGRARKPATTMTLAFSFAFS